MATVLSDLEEIELSIPNIRNYCNNNNQIIIYVTVLNATNRYHTKKDKNKHKFIELSQSDTKTLYTNISFF